MFLDSGNIISDETFCTQSQIWFCVQNVSSEITKLSRMNLKFWHTDPEAERPKRPSSKCRKFYLSNCVIR